MATIKIDGQDPLPENLSQDERTGLSGLLVPLVSNWYQEYSVQIINEGGKPSMQGFVETLTNRNLYSDLGQLALSNYSQGELQSKAGELLAVEPKSYSGGYYNWFPGLNEVGLKLSAYAAGDPKNMPVNYDAANIQYEDEFRKSTIATIDNAIARVICDAEEIEPDRIGRAMVAAYAQTKMLEDIASQRLAMTKTMQSRAVTLHAWQNRQDQLSTVLLLGGAAVGIGTSTVMQATGTRLGMESVYGLMIAGTGVSLFAGRIAKLWTKITDGWRSAAHKDSYEGQSAIGTFLKTFEEVGENVTPEALMDTLKLVNELKVEPYRAIIAKVLPDADRYFGDSNRLQDYLLSDLYTQANLLMVFDYITPNTNAKGHLLAQFVSASIGTFVVNYAAAHIDTAHIIQLIQGR
jgi:hypothetical protein